MHRSDGLRRASSMVLMGFIAVFLSTACLVTSGEPRGTWSDRCGPLPESFDESDLIGAWKVTREVGSTSNVIILRGDGTYKQVLDQVTGEHYESSWNPWWLERRESGGVYVHLKGMRFCDRTAEVCNRSEGGGGDWLFWDFCEDRVFRMEDEVVLAVARGEGHSLYGPAPRGIVLLHMRATEGGAGWFVLQE